MRRHVSGIVVAAGRGERLRAGLPKAFVDLAGRPLLARTIENLASATDDYVVVVPEGWQARLDEHEFRQLPGKRRAVVAGGETRGESVRRGVEALEADTEIVLVHDAARPFLPPGLVERVIVAAEEHGGAIPVVAVPDTVKEEAEGFVGTTVPREMLRLAQTPQGFRASLLREALAVADSLEQELTDEAALFESLGYAVRLVPSRSTNFKITTPEDWRLAVAWAKALDAGEALDA